MERSLELLVENACDYEDIGELQDALEYDGGQTVAKMELTDFLRSYWFAWKAENMLICSLLLKYKFQLYDDDIKYAVELANLASRGDTEGLEKALDEQSRCSVVVGQLKDWEGRTALMWAAVGCWKPTERHLDCAKLLLGRGFATDAADFQGNTALHLAAEAGNLPVIQLLLTAGADPLAQNLLGDTPLAIAEEHDRLEAVAMLRAALGGDAAVTADSQSRSTDEDQDDPEFVTPNLDSELVQSSLESCYQYEVTIEPEKIKRITQLVSAVTHGQLEFVKRVETEALVTLRLSKYVTVLHLAADTRSKAATYAACIAQLLEAGADTKAKNADGDTAAHIAARRDNVSMLGVLPFEDKFLTNNAGLTPLMEAVQLQRWASFKHLLHLFRQARYCQEKQRYLGVKDKSGMTALDLAKETGDPDMIEVLETELRLQVSNSFPCVIGLTMEQEKLRDSLMTLVESGDAEKRLRQLVKRVDSDLPDAWGRTILMRASWSRRCHIATLQQLADVCDPTCADSFGSGCIHWAARYDNEAAVKLLVDAGAWVDAVDQAGRTALMCAAENDRLSAAEALLNVGANMRLRDSEGRSAEQWALMKQYSDIATRLNQLCSAKQQGHEASVSAPKYTMFTSLTNCTVNSFETIADPKADVFRRSDYVRQSRIRMRQRMRCTRNQLSDAKDESGIYLVGLHPTEDDIDEDVEEPKTRADSEYSDKGSECSSTDMLKEIPKSLRVKAQAIVDDELANAETFLASLPNAKDRELCRLFFIHMASEMSLWSIVGQLGQLIPDSTRRIQCWKSAVKLAASQNDYLGASQLAAFIINDQRALDNCLMAAAKAAARHCHWEAASQLINLISDQTKPYELASAASRTGVEEAEKKCRAQMKVAAMAAMNGRLDVFNEYYLMLDSEEHKSECAVKAVKSASSVSNWRVVKFLAASTPLDAVRDECLAAAAVAAADQSHLDEALLFVSRMIDKEQRMLCRMKVSAAAARSNHLTFAKRCIELLDSENRMNECRAVSAVSAATCRHWKAVAEMADSITDELVRDECYSSVVKVSVGQKQWHAVLKLIAKIRDDKIQKESLLHAVGQAASNRLWSGLQSLMNAIQDQSLKSQCRAKALLTAFELDYWDFATKLMDSVVKDAGKSNVTLQRIDGLKQLINEISEPRLRSEFCQKALCYAMRNATECEIVAYLSNAIVLQGSEEASILETVSL